MKKILKNKLWIVLIISGFLVLFFSSNCTQEEPKSSRTSPTKVDGDTSTKTTSDLDCTLPSCSGSCCGDDEDCRDKCTDNFDDGLDVSSSNRDKCFDLKEEDVNSILEIVETIDNTNEDDLAALGEEEISLLCAVGREIEHEILEDRFDDYNSQGARRFLGWAAEQPYVLEIFENVEDDEGAPLFRDLLRAASSESGDLGILEGLLEKVDTEDASNHDEDDETYVVRWAFQEDNEELARWIHENIIAEEDDGLCREANYPVIDAGATNPIPSGETDFAEHACVLAVYCKMAPNDNKDDNEFRKEVAEDEDIGDSPDVEGFISEAVAKGGLGLSDEIADEWRHEACVGLRRLWNDGPLNLGL